MPSAKPTPRTKRRSSKASQEQRAIELAEWRELWAWAFSELDRLRAHIEGYERMADRSVPTQLPSENVESYLERFQELHAWLERELHKLTRRSDHGLDQLRKLKADYLEPRDGDQAIGEAVREVRFYFESIGKRRSADFHTAAKNRQWPKKEAHVHALEDAIRGVVNMMLIRGLATNDDVWIAGTNRHGLLLQKIRAALLEQSNRSGVRNAERYRGPHYLASAVVGKFAKFSIEQVHRAHERFQKGPFGKNGPF